MAFKYGDLDKTHTCPLCKKMTKVGSWRCSCEMPRHLCATHRHNHSARVSLVPQNKPKEPKASRFCRATYAKRKRPACEGYGDRDARQDSHKCAKISKISAQAKRDREIELTQLESDPKVARIYEKLLSRFRGKLGTSSSSK